MVNDHVKRAGSACETFSSLTDEPWLRHAFLQRVPNLDVSTDRETALARLAEIHQETLAGLGFGRKIFITAQQVHGSQITTVTAKSISPVPDCDGLITNDPAVALGIYVADCGAIYLADPATHAIGLLHSGKKGTELGILTHAIAEMQREFGTDPRNLIVQLGPCIRPPHYEVDFANEIGKQAAAAGVIHYYDCGTCTAADPEHYYSYRRESGKTGRLFAVLGYAD